MTQAQGAGARPPLLLYITDSAQLSDASELLEKIRAAFAAGVDWVQVREKQMPTRELAALVGQAAGLPEKRGARLLVNERLDIALACGADGLHLPADSLPVAAVRGAVPRGWLVGVSCHSVEEVEAAAGHGASYALLGPIFDTPGKGAPLGVEVLRRACGRVAALNFPVFALGGITEQNAADCLAAGAAGLAAIRLFQTGDLPRLVPRIRM